MSSSAGRFPCSQIVPGEPDKPSVDDAARSAEEAKVAKRARAITALNLMLACSIGAYQLPFQADNLAVHPNEPARAITALAAAASTSGMLEFLLCPSIGRAADTVGRRVFFLIQGLLTAGVYSATAIQGGTWMPLLLAAKVVRTMNYAMTSASGVLALTVFGDLLTAKGFVVARANMVAISGVISTIMPTISARVMKQKAGMRKIYAATAGLAMGQVAIAALLLPETLPEGQRKPLALANPFGFLKLFSYSRAMTRMMAASLCTNFPELKNLNDLYNAWYRNDTAVDPERFRSLVGLVMIPSGLVMVPSLTKRLGMYGFTTFANLTMSASFLLTAVIPRSGSQLRLMYLSVLLMLPGITGNSGAALRACAMRYAMEAGLGSGEYAGYQASMKAIGGIVAPSLYGRVYSYCKLSGRPPALVWWVVTLICMVMPEVLWRSIPKNELPDMQDK